jgi:tRNA dimethylallyltransferase
VGKQTQGDAGPGRFRAGYLVGPTAVGKTAVAHWLAERTGGAILSADSMAVYRGMDIGTAKPGPEARARVQYYGIDLVDPDCLFSVWDYRRCALEAAAACKASGTPLLVAGGSGLYVSALVQGLDKGPEPDARLRAELEEAVERGGVEAVQRRFRQLAPDAYAQLADPDNPRRLIRAFERAVRGGSAGTWARLPGTAPLVGLRMPVDRLQRRIEQRVHAMYAEGLVEEARALTERHGRLSKTARQAIGYAEALACGSGDMTLQAAIERTIVRTRRLAKRQRTWFAHQVRVEWIDVAEGMGTEELGRCVMELWDRHGDTGIAAD